MIDQIRNNMKKDENISSAVIARKYKISLTKAMEIKKQLMLERESKFKDDLKEFVDKKLSCNVMKCMMNGI